MKELIPTESRGKLFITIDFMNLCMNQRGKLSSSKGILRRIRL